MKGIATVHQYGRYECIGPARLPLKLSDGKTTTGFKIWYFAFPGGQYAALVRGNPRKAKFPLVRIESICIWGHIFGSRYCDCGWQLEEAKRRIEQEGVGIIVFAFDQHGKAVGLRNHFLVYAEGYRRKCEYVVDAYRALGFNVDYRTNYADIADILRHFGVRKVRLLSNNPQRIRFLRHEGIGVRRLPHEAPLDRHNRRELVTKKTKLGHLLALPRQIVSSP